MSFFAFLQVTLFDNFLFGEDYDFPSELLIYFTSL